MDKPDYLKIGCEIKVRRIRAGMTQLELARYLDVSQTHLSNAEGGRVLLSLRLLLKVRDRFKCTLDEIVDPDGYKSLTINRSKKFKRIYFSDNRKGGQ